MPTDKEIKISRSRPTAGTERSNNPNVGDNLGVKPRFCTEWGQEGGGQAVLAHALHQRVWGLLNSLEAPKAGATPFSPAQIHSFTHSFTLPSIQSLSPAIRQSMESPVLGVAVPAREPSWPSSRPSKAPGVGEALTRHSQDVGDDADAPHVCL